MQLRGRLEALLAEYANAKRDWEASEQRLLSDASALKQQHATEVHRLNLELDGLRQRLADAVSNLAMSKNSLEAAESSRLDAESRISRLQNGAMPSVVVVRALFTRVYAAVLRRHHYAASRARSQLG